MKRVAASRYLICAVIFCATLCLPWGNLAAVSAPQVGCSYGLGSGTAMVSGHCCCPAGMPGQCGASGHCGQFTCRCISGNMAFLSPPAAGAPAWQVSPYGPTLITVAVKVFPPNIFHPPELNHFSLQI
jgi:hypothetical protein